MKIGLDGNALTFAEIGGFKFSQKEDTFTVYPTQEDLNTLRELIPRSTLEKDIIDGAVKVLIAKQIELRVQAEMEKTELRLLTEKLFEKANNLARFVEQFALAPVAGYYEQLGNPAPLKLLRMAVEDVDRLTKKGGAR
jgi:hypothetical protein